MMFICTKCLYPCQQGRGPFKEYFKAVNNCNTRGTVPHECEWPGSKKHFSLKTDFEMFRDEPRFTPSFGHLAQSFAFSRDNSRKTVKASCFSPFARFLQPTTAQKFTMSKVYARLFSST